jgi:hypothetical protein
LDDAWRFSGTLAYRVPTGWVLYGLLAEDSAARQSEFYLWAVRMPLLVPTDVIDLSWSQRFGGSSRVFDAGDSATLDALGQAAKQVTKQASIGGLLLDPPGGAENVRMQEARAYGLLLEGNSGGAIEVLGRVTRYDARYPWEVEIVRRAGAMRSIIEKGQTSAAVGQVETWRLEAIVSLGISPDEILRQPKAASWS